ncbi:MAG: serine hydrolase domain-containing protein [Candidatus Heimdallarchaeota archaeon]
MNKLTHKIFGSNTEEISDRIQRIENSLVGIDDQSPVDKKQSIAERMAEYKIPGLCIAVINNYKIEWAKSYGVRNINVKDDPITLNTIFQAASITKVLMALMTLHLVEKEILDLDEPVNTKLKNWKIPANDFTKDKEITLRHILTHSSGISMPFTGFGREEGSAPTIMQTLKGETPAKNEPAEVVFAPESRHQYSNFGFIMIEKLLQDVTGKKLNDLAKEILYEPLGITNSFLEYPSEELQKRMIYPYNYNSGKVFEQHVGLSPGVFGCGGLISTALDIATIAIDLMKTYQGNSSKILSTSMAKQMISHKITLNPNENFGSTAQGLGIFLCEKEEHFFFTHRGGGEPGSSSVFMGNPKSGHGVAMMANSNVGHALFAEMKHALANEYNWSLWGK